MAPSSKVDTGEVGDIPSEVPGSSTTRLTRLETPVSPDACAALRELLVPVVRVRRSREGYGGGGSIIGGASWIVRSASASTISGGVGGFGKVTAELELELSCRFGRSVI